MSYLPKLNLKWVLGYVYAIISFIAILPGGSFVAQLTHFRNCTECKELLREGNVTSLNSLHSKNYAVKTRNIGQAFFSTAPKKLKDEKTQNSMKKLKTQG